MEATNKPYDHVAGVGRIDSILSIPQSNYEELDTLPSRDKLTFTNGYYANKTVAVFVDIRDSSSLPDIYKRPALARLYRAYISEMVAILNSHAKAVEVNIVGDGVWAIINAPCKSDIDEVFETVAKMNSLMKVLNYKLKKANYGTPIRAGIGASFGRALMIKAGLSGSGINDVVYMGDVVNRAAKLASKGSNGYGAAPIYLSNVFVSNLKDEYQAWTTKDWTHDCYTASVINSAMDEWYENNCK
ncbi:adenylate/guanylate cyclase domain-containing protein [Jiangella rhizosphaerae]|uniref:Adenylate/guanylate cyclase domain-containing protein n=1 Tax=Jiangella rhizosphaerae TaxID=2293569 RepID=A0A418KP62_9ACTN|nr:adenylate/guanylate cyclase domain-containing protein [Jiangella rhizosphaerae]RIQ21053.1 adenylate/guanylate cyclase domain-containing protein [Jiangella rhizosphaerae]